MLACDISIMADNPGGGVGDRVTFTVNVEITHRNCSVPIDETYLSFDKMAYVSQTSWKLVSSSTYQSVVTAELTSAGTGSITVTRICPTKGGDEATINYFIADSAGGTSPPASGASEPGITDEAPQTPIMPNLPTEKTWSEAFKDVFSQSYVIVYILLTLFAYIAFIKGQKWWRYVSLTFSMVYLGFFLGLCPSALGSLQTLLREGTEVKTHLINYAILGVPLVSTIFFGRLFCGWVCPMGAVQQLIYRKDIAIKVPQKLHNILKYFKYLVLAVTVFAVLYSGVNVFCEIDPFKSLFNMQIEPIPTTLLVILLLASLVIFAPWCKYVCPLGAFLSLFAKITRNKFDITSTCKNCKACSKTFCEYKAIDDGEVAPVINDMECVRCGECKLKCPKKSIVYANTAEESTKVHTSGTISP